MSFLLTGGNRQSFAGVWGYGSLSRSQRMWEPGAKAVQNTIGMNYFPSAVPNYKILRARGCSCSPQRGGREEGGIL